MIGIVSAFIIGCALSGCFCWRDGFNAGKIACAKEHLARLAQLEEAQATLHRVVIEATRGGKRP